MAMAAMTLQHTVDKTSLSPYSTTLSNFFSTFHVSFPSPRPISPRPSSYGSLSRPCQTVRWEDQGGDR